MFLIGWLVGSPLRMAIGLIFSALVVVIIFAGINVILAFSGGPGPCTPGGGPITINPANAQVFDDKWQTLNDALNAGSPATANFNESEVSSFVDREIGSPFSDPRVCIHDGFGEGTATLDILGFDAKIKVTGNVDLSGPHPVAQVDDIEIGNVPGFVTGIIESFVQNAIDDETQKVDLEHLMDAIPSEGSAQVDGVP